MNKCLDCGVELIRSATMSRIVFERVKRCGKCNHIHLGKKNLAGRKGEKHPRWKGGITEQEGYRFVKVYDHPYSAKNNYYPEHRLVIEKSIGRYLLPVETVHHLNQNTLDNRLENLVLCSSRGQHTKIYHPEIAEKQRLQFKGQHHSPKTEFKKGMIPWNKRK